MSFQTEVRQDIAAKIIAAIKAGHVPWRASVPTNALTGKKYQGINPLLLDSVAHAEKYRSRYWATYTQWQQLGLQVRKRPQYLADVGWWGVPVISWKNNVKAVDHGSIIKMESFKSVKSIKVFNAEQVFGLDVGNYFGPITESTDFAKADEVIAATRAVIYHKKSCRLPRYQRPPRDRIIMPFKEFFQSESQYYSTLFHELCHWAEWRTGWSGDEAQGELAAEIGMGCLEGELGLPRCTDMTNHNLWTEQWLQKMDEGADFLFGAAAQAAKAVNYILG